MRRHGPVPRPVVAVALAAAAVVAVPLVAVLWRAPWARMPALLSSPEALEALRLSAVVSAGATAGCIALGLPLAWTLARTTSGAAGVLRAVVMLPMVLPPVVGGTGLLLAFGRFGVIGRPLEALLGVRLPFTVWGAVLAAGFVAFPFFVVAAESGLRSLDTRLEDAARTLGARPARVFVRVTLPLASPALLAAAALAWARAFGEFGATITFAGNVRGTTRTLPLAVFVALESRPDAAFALSVVMLVVSLAVLAALRGRLLSPGGPA